VVKRGLYIVYVVVVVLMVVIAGQDDGDDRTWGNSASGTLRVVVRRWAQVGQGM
jgi:hypothetical protein